MPADLELVMKPSRPYIGLGDAPLYNLPARATWAQAPDAMIFYLFLISLISVCAYVNTHLLSRPILMQWFSDATSIYYSISCLLVSLFLGGQSRGDHSLVIKHIDLFSLSIHGFRVSFPSPDSPHAKHTHSYFLGTSISFVSLSLNLRRPSRTNPAFATIILSKSRLRTTLCVTSVKVLTVRLLLFPSYFRFSAGPFVDATLDTLKLRVFSSARTPYQVKRLREACIGGALWGEILRVDYFKTSVEFEPEYVTKDPAEPIKHALGKGIDSSISVEHDPDEAFDYPSAAARSFALHSNAHSNGNVDGRAVPERDDVLVHGEIHGMMFHDGKGRMYAFGDICAALRRTYGSGIAECDRGSFDMEAHGCTWVRIPAYVLGDSRFDELPFWRYAPVTPQGCVVHSM